MILRQLPFLRIIPSFIKLFPELWLDIINIRFSTSRINVHLMPTVIENWRDLFAQWPADLNRRGILVTSFGEQIPFSAFWTSSNLLLLERQTPDSLGARTILLDYKQISAMKIVDVVKSKSFQSIGFEGPPSKN
jgi:hypothetical protein